MTEKEYRDFVLMLEFRMPTISDSGIMFRRLIPEIPGFGNQEQFNLRSKGGMGHLESYYFLPKETAEKMGLKEEEKPHVRHIDPEVGVWHTVKLTMKGRTFSAEYDGEVLHDNFQFHDWMMNMEPAPIRLQKHIVVHGDNLGDENPCPIEYRNIFIKELGPSDVSRPVAHRRQTVGRNATPRSGERSYDLLARIDKTELPDEYDPAKHQEYVDRRWPKLSPEQVARALQLWKVKQEIDPDMPNRGFSFVKILDVRRQWGNATCGESTSRRRPVRHGRSRQIQRRGDSRGNRLLNRSTLGSGRPKRTNDGANRKATPVKISEEQTIDVASFGVSGRRHAAGCTAARVSSVSQRSRCDSAPGLLRHHDHPSERRLRGSLSHLSPCRRVSERKGLRGHS